MIRSEGAQAVAPASRLLTTPAGALRVEPSPARGLRFSLVIPTYNEAENLGTLIGELERLLTPELGESYELIVVDDDSPDRTWEVALSLCAAHPRLSVIRRIGERDLSTAVIRGWQAAGGEFLGVMDADLQHPVESNLRLLEEMERGADLAVASRHVKGGGVSDWSISRRLVSRGAQLLGLLLLPGVFSRLSDPMSGYFVVRRSALAEVTFNPIGYKILLEVVARARIRWTSEVGYVFRERKDGSSKVTLRIYARYLAHLARLRWATLPESRLFRFCVVGSTGVVIDMGLLYLFHDPQALDLDLTLSKFMAAGSAMTSNFFLNDAWTFGEVREKDPGFRLKLRRFLGFTAICSAGLVINVILLHTFVRFGVNRYVANAFAILAVTGWNYWLNSQLNWSERLGLRR